MTAELEGKVAVVTGGASGIGEATVRQFVAEGAQVIVADLQDGPGEDLAEELGDAARFVHTDVSVEAQVAGAIRAAVDAFGGLDVLYNNAGFVGATGPLESTTAEEYDLTMDVLLKAVFFGIKHASPIMKAQRSGSIISTSSVCGLTAGVGTHLYSVAKAAVIMLTKTAALELADWQVRVNAVCPGYVATPLGAGGSLTELGRDTTEERLAVTRDRLAHSQPIGRMGEAADIARLVTFLASDASSWITGTAQVIDGGLTLGKPWPKQPRAVTEHRPLAPSTGA
jgi:NAD(P)-dependent dehydrogenase (short-subunit alcohol dehydrogenase family)